VATNPGTLLGFGTWVSLGEGRMLIGAGAGSGLTARTATSSSGAETVTLVEANLPAHRHRLYTWNGTGDDDKVDGFQRSGDPAIGGEISSPKALSTTNAAGTNLMETTGSGTAFDIMNPWVCVYIWRRTA